MEPGRCLGFVVLGFRRLAATDSEAPVFDSRNDSAGDANVNQLVWNVTSFEQPVHVRRISQLLVRIFDLVSGEGLRRGCVGHRKIKKAPAFAEALVG